MDIFLTLIPKMSAVASKSPVVRMVPSPIGGSPVTAAAAVEIATLQTSATAATVTAVQIEASIQQIIQSCTALGLSSAKVTGAFSVMNFASLIFQILTQVQTSLKNANLPALDTAQEAEAIINIAQTACQKLSEAGVIQPDTMAKINSVVMISDLIIELVEMIAKTGAFKALEAEACEIVTKIKTNKCCCW
jgi:hypothetical protein